MQVTRRTASIAAALLSLGWAGTAAADVPFGPKPGSLAPDIGALADQDGEPRRLNELAGPKGVVLMFYRSAGWCPICQAQLIAMDDAAAEIARRGYRLVGVSYDEPAVTKAFSQRRGIGYPLLSDPKSASIDRWGLRDPQYPPGHRAHGVPRPAIYVIDRQGVIRAALAEETFRKRPPVAAVLDALDD